MKVTFAFSVEFARLESMQPLGYDFGGICFWVNIALWVFAHF